ncbi:hypothetical protein [Glutamicibacter sp. TV12E]|uniref:hypothetical protein n=1 Tax=Glutamicibacter sp. TV12E TaxID=3446362 RepID=UPI004033B026
MELSQRRNLAVVAGNGLSVAFSSELVLGKITERLLEELTKIAPNGNDVLRALAKVATRIEDDGALDVNDFEQLVGAFESQAALLEDLSDLAGLASNGGTRLQQSLEDVRQFTRQLLRMGTGIVLKIILDSSPTNWESTKHLHSFFRSFYQEFSGTITFSNLNYDYLVLATLRMLDFSFCDMADPRKPAQITFTDDEIGEHVVVERTKGYELRGDLSFPADRRIRLIHPHGSFAYWQNTYTGAIVKFPIESLRRHNILSDMDDGSKHMMPVVVLANSREKPRRVLEQPFKLAYEAMAQGLSESKHWLIVGYSFRDDSVNAELLKAFLRHDPKPKILISTFGNDLKRSKVEDAIGWGAEDGTSFSTIIFDRDGVEGIEERDPWSVFIS